MGKIRKAIASLSIVAILSTLVVSTTVSAAWYDTFVDQLVEAGVVNAGGDAYRPGDNASRCESVKMLVLMAGLESDAPATPTFSDVPANSAFYPYVETAAANSIVQGYTNGKFGCNDPVTREQFAKITVETFDLPVVDYSAADWPFSDSVPSWAQDYVTTVYTYGIVSGYPDGTFGGSKNINRAETAKLVVFGAEPPTPPEEDMDDDAADDDAADDDAADDDAADDDAADDDAATGDLEVSLSADTPEAITLADGTAFNALAVVDFTAGAEDADVSSLTVTKLGITSDTNIKVSVWVDGVRQGNVLTVSEGKAVITFNTPIRVSAGETEPVTLAANIDAAAGSGTVGLGINAVEDVELAGGEVTGEFPVNGGTFGIVDGANSVAASTFDVNSLSATTRSVDPQLGYRVTRFTIQETGSQESLLMSGLTLFDNGTVADGDITNIVVKDQNGNPLGSAESTVNKVAEVVFDEVYEIPKGTTRYLDVYVDIVGGATRTSQLIVQNDFDVILEGKSTGASILAIANSGGTDTSFPIGDRTTGQTGYNHITINEGTLSLTKDNSSPSGDVTLGSSDQILGSFTLQAQGEDIELQRIALDNDGNSAGQTDVWHAGVASQNTTGAFECGSGTGTSGCDLSGSIQVVTADGKGLYTVSAATSTFWGESAPVYATLSAYHTIPAGETETIYIKGNIASDSTYTGSGETLQVGINKIYYYKKSSLKYADTGSALANTLSVTTSSLTVSSDTSYGAQTIVSGTSAVKIGSFRIKGSTAEAVNVTSIGVSVNNENDDSATGVSNLKLYLGGDNTGTQLGATQASVADESAMTISVSNFQLDVGEEVTVSAYADISSVFTDDTDTVVVTVSANGVSGTGTTSQSTAQGPTNALALQTITLNTSGSLTIALADDNPITKQLVAGTAYTADEAAVAKFKLTANQAENIYLKKFTVRTDTDANDVAFSGAALYGSATSSELGTLLGTRSMQSDTTRPGFISWDWAGSSRPKISSNSSYYLTVKANVVSGSQAAVTSLTPVIQLVDVEAEGSSAIVPKNNALDHIPTKVVLGTFAAPATATDLKDTNLTAAQTTITLAGTSAGAAANATSLINTDAGFYCYIGTTGYPIAGGTEIFYLMGATTPASTGVYQIERGVFGTTPAAVTSSGDDENIFCVAAPKGNIIQTLNTKLTASTDTTGLDTSAKTEMKLAKIKLSAASNAVDAFENKATIQKLRITVTSTNADATSFVMYPDEHYNNATYAITGKYVADSVVEFRFDDANADGTTDTTITATVYDDIIEGQSRTYTIKANTVSGTNGSLDVQLAKTGSASTATYGSSTGSDIVWLDGPSGLSPSGAGTTSSWFNQTGTNVNLRYFSSSSSTGTPDTTAPVISCTASCMVSQTVDGTITAADVHGFTFDAAMSQVTFTDVKMSVAGTITADFTAQAVADGTLFSFATAGAATVASYTPAWNSSTNFRLTVGVVGGTAATEYEGVITPSATLFMDVYGNAGPTGTATAAW